MSHERSITVEVDGGHYNIPTVRGGKRLTDDEATQSAIRENRLGRRYGSVEEAVKAAGQRSIDAGLELQKRRP